MTSLKSLLLIMLTGACATSGATTTAPRVNDPVPMTERAAPTATDATAVLAAYERARALLAKDELPGLGDAARELAQAAKAAGAATSSTHYSEIASGAVKLGAARDLAEARATFGEISRHLVALLASDPALARGQHVFECPMVKGYRKWVQPSEDLQNPYMGKRMLACGGESTWK